MFNTVTITEQNLKSLLASGSRYIEPNFRKVNNIFSEYNSDIRDRLKTFKLGIIIDDLSECFLISKSVEDFVKHSTSRNGFLKYKNINNQDYIEIVIYNEDLLINNLVSTLKDCGFELLFREFYSLNFVQIGFKRSNGKEELKYLYWLDDRGYKPKIKREGIVCLTNGNYTYRNFYFTEFYSINEFLDIANTQRKNNCFGFIVYKIDISKIKDFKYGISLDNPDIVYSTTDIPQEAISIEIEEKHE